RAASASAARPSSLRLNCLLRPGRRTARAVVRLARSNEAGYHLEDSSRDRRPIGATSTLSRIGTTTTARFGGPGLRIPRSLQEHGADIAAHLDFPLGVDRRA